MDFGVTGKAEAYLLAEQYRKRATEGKSVGMSFAELAALGKSAGMGLAGLSESGKSVGMSFAELAALGMTGKPKQADASGVYQEGNLSGTGTGLYMGESYEERLSKITDKRAAAASQAAYAKKMAGSTDYISAISKAYSMGNINAANFTDAFPQYNVVTHVGNADISPAHWQRNDFPFWKYFQKDTSADALNDWRPVGANPPQTRGDLQRNYSSIGPGRIAVLIPESLQKKMDADPAYARQIMAKLQEWKEDYDRWDNTVAASYGYDVAEHQASKSYVFDLDENGDVRNCTVTGGGGGITGPTEEERKQFEAEQERKRRLRVKYIQIQEESAARKRMQEQEYLNFVQNRLLQNDLFSGL